MRTSHWVHFAEATLAGCFLALSAALTSSSAQVFTLDTNQSSVTISGTVLGGTISPQAAGSLTAKMSGQLQATVAGNTIRFSGHSQILAQTNGSWQPMADGTAGSAPADFGGQANLGFAAGVAALRDVQLDVISPAISLSGGQFESTNLTFLFPSNSTSSIAYNVSGLVNNHGAVVLVGYGTNKVTALSSLSNSGSQQVLTIPVDATFYLSLVSADDTAIRLQGQLVAHSSAPSSFKVQSLAVQAQAVLLQWQAPPGQQVQIQSSTDFRGWQTNATIMTPASGSYTWTGAITGPVQFFRLAK